MPSEVRLTLAVARVLREFLADASRPRYGYDLMQATGYPSGKLYPILARLQRAGWLGRAPEAVDPAQAGLRATCTCSVRAARYAPGRSSPH